MNVTKKILAFLISAVILFCVFPIGVFAENEDDVVENPEIPADAMIYKGHSYRVYTDSSIGWHDAQAFCEKLGGHLATITNAGEDDFIYSLVADYGISCWLGATDEETEGEWKWVTGEAWDYSNASFDNCGDLQHYLTINHHGSVWDDQSEKETSDNGALCDTGGFVCEWETVSDIQLSYFERILGVYEGSYTATQGITGLTLSIYRIQELLSDNLLLQKYADVANSCSVSSDENVAIFNVEDVKAIVSQHNEEYIALFNFFPIVDDTTGEASNPDVEEGLYTMTISYDATTGTYEFIGNQWIQHDTYAMADLKNITFTDNTLSGDVYGEYASWFWTEYGDVGDVSVCRGDLLSGYRIDFDCESTSLRIDEAQQIKAFVKNNQGVLAEDVADIMWFSKDESIAKITGENWGGNNFEYSVGTILGVSEGETEICAKLGNNRIAVCTVSVKDKITKTDVDSDGDGLFDDWEKYGADIDEDGVVDVDLPAMGADPNIPDIFVEIDWMVRPQKKFFFWETQSHRNLAPSSTAMYMVYQAFKVHKINIHIDAGEDSIDFVTGNKWGDLSQGNQIAYVKSFDLDNWGATVQENFTNVRSYIFRHCIFVDQYNNTTSSGIANGIPGQYFIVANQDWVFEGGDTSVAGTFMHELGHTLGLKHGGCDHVHYKPNYLSIMNYLFQTTGLAGTGSIDYSNYKLPDIDENDINESLGVDPYGTTAGTGLGTKWYHNGKQFSVESVANSAIDFDNDGSIENDIKLDLNNNLESILYGGHNDWENLIYKAGNLGGAFFQGEEYYNTGNTYVYEKTLEESLITNTLANVGDGSVDCVVNALIVGLDNQPLFFDIYNRTSVETIYTIELDCPELFVNFSQNVTVQGSVNQLEKTRITIYPYSNIQAGDYVVDCKLKYNNQIVFEKLFIISVSELTSQDEEEIIAAINNGELDDSGIDIAVVSMIKGNFKNEHTHTYGEWIKVDATNHKHTCECGEYETENHLFGDWVITKEASESETGTKEKSCVCGHAVTEEIPQKVVETDPSNPSTDSNDSNESEPSNTFGEKNDANIFDILESIPKETIIIVGASIAGVILLVVICAIVKKKRS